MAGPRRQVICLVPVLFVAVGCKQKEMVYYTQTEPAVEWSDLALGGSVEVQDAYRLVVREPTRGVFPAAVAVARVAAIRDEKARMIVLDMKPEVDFLDWNSLFDDLRSVSEAFPLNVMALDGRNARIDSLLDSAKALEAKMLLVYTEMNMSANRCVIRGVLYDVPNRRTLASIQRSAYVEDPIPLNREHDSDETPEAQLERDPRLLAMNRFESSMRECVLSLMANDEPADPVAPEGWIPDRPIEPMMWPPVGDLPDHLELRRRSRN